MTFHQRPLYAQILVSIAVCLSAIFAIGVLWYQGPSALVLRMLFVLVWLALTITSIILFVRGSRTIYLLAYALPFTALVLWFAAIEPSNDRAWSPEMARTLTYTSEGEKLVVSNVRNFHWAGPTTAEQNWETRSYDLSELASVDVLSLYWKGPRVAHTYFSFVWKTGEALSISVEIRKEMGEAYSPIGGFFKAYELAVLAGDERDFYGWRVFFPSEDIQLFQTKANPVQARALLLALLENANQIAATPVFYNTLTENCTTEVWMLTSALGKGQPRDWRILASGYLPEFLYDQNILDTTRPLDEIRKQSHILPAAKLALHQGLSGPQFSSALRSASIKGPRIDSSNKQ